MKLLLYLRSLCTGRTILWCYLIWYLVFAVLYFDPSPRLWLTSLGISAIIGVALVISTTSSSDGPVKLDRWQTARLFLMPFCVSSFAALVKGQEFLLIFSPKWKENLLALGLCAAFWLGVKLLKRSL
ncbi:MAG: hypothetical protein HYY24_08770 [Verrucomicrobia bacterium]|nr:hypothetical protein [Verrucomicrobiota bacterium]